MTSRVVLLLSRNNQTKESYNNILGTQRRPFLRLNRPLRGAYDPPWRVTTAYLAGTCYFCSFVTEINGFFVIFFSFLCHYIIVVLCEKYVIAFQIICRNFSIKLNTESYEKVIFIFDKKYLKINAGKNFVQEPIDVILFEWDLNKYEQVRNYFFKYLKEIFDKKININLGFKVIFPSRPLKSLSHDIYSTLLQENLLKLRFLNANKIKGIHIFNYFINMKQMFIPYIHNCNSGFYYYVINFEIIVVIISMYCNMVMESRNNFFEIRKCVNEKTRLLMLEHVIVISCNGYESMIIIKIFENV